MTGERITDRMYSVEQAAELLGLSVSWVRRLCQSGRIGQRVGKRGYVVFDHDIADYKANRKPRGWQKGKPRKAETGELPRPKKAK